jgi:hypothetical protein
VNRPELLIALDATHGELPLLAHLGASVRAAAD